MKRRIINIVSGILAVFCIVTVMTSAAVSVGARAYAKGKGVDVTVGGSSFCAGENRLVDDTTCVPLRDFVSAMTGGAARVTWDGDSATATVSASGVTIKITDGEHYIVANGRYLWCGTENYVNENDRMMTAVRPLAKAFGATVDWNRKYERCVVGVPGRAITSGDNYYNKDDLYWLSRIINAESRGEPLIGKLAVGAVIYNRVRSDEYPDTVYDVIFDMSSGVQFTPAKTGSVYDTPTEESVIAAKICMEGYIYRDDIMYFCTKEIMTTCWAGRNRPYIMTIGGHAFFA